MNFRYFLYQILHKFVFKITLFLNIISKVFVIFSISYFYFYNCLSMGMSSWTVLCFSSFSLYILCNVQARRTLGMRHALSFSLFRFSFFFFLKKSTLLYFSKIKTSFEVLSSPFLSLSFSMSFVTVFFLFSTRKGKVDF